MPGTHVHTTVQIFIVVVSAATAVATTVQKLIVVCMPATHVPYDSTNIYREGGRKGGRKGGSKKLL